MNIHQLPCGNWRTPKNVALCYVKLCGSCKNRSFEEMYLLKSYIDILRLFICTRKIRIINRKLAKAPWQWRIQNCLPYVTGQVQFRNFWISWDVIKISVSSLAGMGRSKRRRRSVHCRHAHDQEWQPLTNMSLRFSTGKRKQRDVSSNKIFRTQSSQGICNI